MSAVEVWLSSITRDWVARCDETCARPLHFSCDNWGDAYETALGHACWQHAKDAA